MLTKMVDGKSVVCSAEEEKLLRMKWDLNDRYPEYQGHLMFDGISEPKHDIEACKKTHISLVNGQIAKQIALVNDQIEESLENGLDVASLYAKRKSLKVQMNPTLSNMETVADLKAHLEKVKTL